MELQAQGRWEKLVGSPPQLGEFERVVLRGYAEIRKFHQGDEPIRPTEVMTHLREMGKAELYSIFMPFWLEIESERQSFMAEEQKERMESIRNSPKGSGSRGRK